MKTFSHKLKSIVKYFLFVIKWVLLYSKNTYLKAIRVIGAYKRLSLDNHKRDEVKSLSFYYPDLGNMPQRGAYVHPCSVDLSIIIPMYNVSKYIQECLDSILSQMVTYTIEVILVDDGSTDETLDKIVKYKRDKRVVMITQNNQGQSVARNNALNISRGRYIMFVDGDDILLPDSIQTLMKAAIETNSDIIEGNVARFSEKITDEILQYYRGKYHVESNTNNQRFVLTTYGYSVAKVFRRELWQTLRYPEGYIFEDMITRYISRRKANQVVFIKDVVYGYRNNNTSSSHGHNHLKKLDSIWVLPKIFELVELEKAPRDEVFYLLALNDIGMINYVTTRPFDSDIRLACLFEMRKQLESIQDCKPKKMPLMFRLLDKAILENRFEAWEYIAGTIHQYNMLKKWREIN